jgi:hypothetical protein
MKQKDIPAWEELQACVKRICLASSLTEMRSQTEQEYLAAKTAGKSKYATIEAFINFALLSYLTDPRNPPKALPHAAPYSGEMASIQYRLRQLGEL